MPGLNGLNPCSCQGVLSVKTNDHLSRCLPRPRTKVASDATTTLSLLKTLKFSHSRNRTNPDSHISCLLLRRVYVAYTLNVISLNSGPFEVRTHSLVDPLIMYRSRGHKPARQHPHNAPHEVFLWCPSVSSVRHYTRS
jgi:hypothetical protein